MAYKCFNDFVPGYLIDNFTKRSEICNCLTRNHHLLDNPFFRTSSGQRTFQYRAVKIWNNLDNDLIIMGQ